MDPQKQHVVDMRDTLATMRQGELPSTKAVVDTVDKVKSGSTRAEMESMVSPTGKKILHDVDNVVTKFQDLLMDKNKGNHLQEMIFHAKKASELTKTEHLKFGAGSSTTEMRSHLSSSFQSFIDVVKTVVTSPEFRTVLKSLLSLVFDILKFNLGPAAVIPSTFGNVRQEMDRTADGEQSSRDAAHNIVDIIGDSVNHNVPDHVQNNVAQSSRNIYQGKESVTETSRSLGRKTMDSMKEAKNKFEVPAEYQDEMIERLRQTISKIQQRPDYQRNVDEMFSSFGNLVKASKDTGYNTMQKGKASVTENDALSQWQISFAHARVLLENIFGGNTLDGLIHTISVFMNDLKNDDQLFSWFESWQSFLDKALKDSAFLYSNKFVEEFKNLVNRASQLFKGQYGDHVSEVSTEFTKFTEGAAEDSTNSEFAAALRQFASDMFTDENGNLTIKRELLADLGRVIPFLADKVAYVPLPRIEFEDANHFLTLDNVILKCSGLIPSNLHIGTSANVDLSVPQIQAKLQLHVSDIQMSAENIDFEFRRKASPFRFSDSGKVDFAVTGRGLQGDFVLIPWIQMENNQSNKGFEINTCNVNIDKLHTKFHDTVRHRMLYSIFGGGISATLRKVLSKTLSDSLRKMMDPHQTADVTGTAKAAKNKVKFSMPTILSTSGVAQSHGHDHVSAGEYEEDPFKTSTTEAQNVVGSSSMTTGAHSNVAGSSNFAVGSDENSNFGSSSQEVNNKMSTRLENGLNSEKNDTIRSTDTDVDLEDLRDRETSDVVLG